MNHQRSILSRVWIILGVLVVVILVTAAGIMLFMSARMQQGLLSKAPKYEATTLFSKAVEQSDKGDYTAAEGYLESALNQQDDASFRTQMAVVKYRLKKYDASITQYRILIDTGHDASFAWNGIGNAYRDWALTDPAQKEARETLAIDAYKKSLTLNAQYVAAYSNLAQLLDSQGNKAEALAIIDQGIAATNRPELSQVKNNLSTAQ